MKTVSIKISGRVQGVGFRINTKNKAEELNLKGFVRNEPDGTVYIEAKGSKDSVERFIEWCKSGPSFAEVENIKIKSIDSKDLSGFKIRY